MWFLALLLPAHACETATRTSDVVDAAGRAEVAYANLDAAGFEAALARARDDLRCLGEPLSVDGAAAWHRAEALGAFLGGDEGGARGHFAGARAAQPGWRLPSAIAPEGHPLRAVFDEAIPGTDTFALTLPPEAAWCSVDGVRATVAPSDRPFALQCFASDGSVRSTGEASEADFDGMTPLPVEPMPEPAHPTKPRARVGLAVSAGALALGAGAAFAVAGIAHDQYWDPMTAPGKLPDLMVATNASTVSGAALGAAALGCATGALLVGRF